MKTCSRCGEEKDLSAFRRRGGARTSDIQAYCNSCQTEYQHHYRLRKFYGLTVERVEEILEGQYGSCGICNTPLKPSGKEADSVRVDHDHDTGRVRGLLCDLCNRGLGYFKDNPHLLRSAAQYIEVPE